MDSIFVAGHKGMVGSAIMRALQKKGYLNIIIANRTGNKKIEYPKDGSKYNNA